VRKCAATFIFTTLARSSVCPKITFDFRFIFVYSEGGFDGSGAGKASSWIKQLPRGEPQNGQQPLQSVGHRWVDSYRGPGIFGVYRQDQTWLKKLPSRVRA